MSLSLSMFISLVCGFPRRKRGLEYLSCPPGVIVPGPDPVPTSPGACMDDHNGRARAFPFDPVNVIEDGVGRRGLGIVIVIR